MSSFIEQAACRGRHPHGFSAHQRRSRSDLVARLLRQRRVARFLVAPEGFGKSYLAYEYASVVFSFNHVFWINGRSPCFLRDIDAGTMHAAILRADREACLVVFEDIPCLEDDRVGSFSQLVGDLLASGNEVLVTCTPSCDAYGDLHPNRMLLDGYDLLLDEEEARLAFMEEAHERGSVLPPLRSELIPCLRWGGEGALPLMAGVKREEFPIDDLMIVFTLMLLQRGKLTDAEAFMGAKYSRDAVERLARHYPFLGIDLEEGVYETARVSVDDLAAGFGTRLDDLAEFSPFGIREAFALRCADALMVRGLEERAAAVALAFSTKRSCARWLASRGWDLLASVAPKVVVDTYMEVDRSISRRRVAFYAILAEAFAMLDAASDARSFACKAAFSTAGESSARAIGCMVLLRTGLSEERLQAREVLEKLLMAHELGLDCAMRDSDSEEDADIAAMWPALARLTLAFGESLARGVKSLCAMLDVAERGGFAGEPSALTHRALMAACSWVFDAVSCGEAYVGVPGDMQWAREAELDVHFIEGEDFESILCFSCAAVENAVLARGQVDWYELRLASSLERAYEHDPIAVTHVPSFAAMSVARKAQIALFSQRDAYRKSSLVSAVRPHASLDIQQHGARHEALQGKKETPQAPQPPLLRVNLFGAFEVRLGDEMVDPTLFARRKMRTLLAILVLSRGKEFTRETLAKMLWPNSSEKSAKKSFYALWSKLRQILSIDGKCPYLIRDQHGCRLNPRLVVSDVMQFEDMCRMLLFGRSDERGWEQIYAQVSVEFSEDLLPGEVSNDLVIALREHYHTQLVDALIAASSRMVAAGETRGALWFAREALRRDRSREDAYVAQMEAQIAAEQRAAALETFFSCRRFLADELGIDPSIRIVSLYRAIIETEESLE